LGGTAVTDAGLEELAGFQNLQSLHLPGQVTDAAISRLQAALPTATISAARPPYAM
jgi:hypothetical protein